MHFSFLTLFPQLIEGYFSDSILKNAREKGLISVEAIQIRDFATNAYKSVDMPQIGGGAGQVLSYEVLSRALCFLQKNALDFNMLESNERDFHLPKSSLQNLQNPKTQNLQNPNLQKSKDSSLGNFLGDFLNSSAKKSAPHIIFLTPCAKPFTQNDAKRLAQKSHIAFVCGRYEGIDERAIERFADEVFCIGDFVLTGGELPALCLCDSIARNIKGVLGNSESLQGESFENYLLEAPVFARHIKENPSKKIAQNDGKKCKKSAEFAQDFAHLDSSLDFYAKSSFGANDSALLPQNAKNNENFANFCAPSVYSKGNHSKISVLKNDLAVCKTRYFRPNLFEKWKIHNPKNPKKKG